MEPPRTANRPSIYLELASALLVPAAAIGFIRVFDDLSVLVPIIGAGLLSTAIAVLARRAGLSLLSAAAISGVVITLLITNRFAPGTTRLGIIPTGATRDALSLQIDDLVSNFRNLKTPVPPLQPFVAAAMLGAWVMAFLTDWGAMRLRLAFEPVLPSALIFLFTAIPPVSAGTHQLQATVPYAAAVGIWAVAQRVTTLRERGVWLEAEASRGVSSLAKAGLAAAAIAVLTGAFVGDKLPGAEADPIYSFSNAGDSTRLVVSPFVRIRSRLVDQSDQQLFTVESDEPAYWRIAGLDTYDDGLWKFAGDFSRESGSLESTDELQGQRRQVTQTYSIDALAAIWLPAAYQPVEILETDTEVTWNADTSSLTVNGKTPDGDGVTYTIASSLVDFSAEDLRNSPNDLPESITSRYLDLPALPPLIAQTAQEAVAGQPTRFDQMLALQNFFLTQFNYNVNLAPRTGEPISQFLNEREGFCQQFAGTFAVMARQLGVPARVATGFTWGDPIGTAEDGRTIYKVTGAQTHAWPEVYFTGLGWVPFEPTPGRGIPNISYTGTQPSQVSEQQPELPEESAAPEPEPEQPLDSESPEFEEETPLEEEDPTFDTDSGAEGDTDGEGADSEPGRSIMTILSIIAGLILPLLALTILVGGMPFLHYLHRRLRRWRSPTPDLQVETAWEEAMEAVDIFGGARRSEPETRTEFAGRLVAEQARGAVPLRTLAESATAARFSPTSLKADDAARSAKLAAAVTDEARSAHSLGSQYVRLLNPAALARSVRRASYWRSMISDPFARQTADPAESGTRPTTDKATKRPTERV